MIRTSDSFEINLGRKLLRWLWRPPQYNINHFTCRVFSISYPYCSSFLSCISRPSPTNTVCDSPRAFTLNICRPSTPSPRARNSRQLCRVPDPQNNIKRQHSYRTLQPLRIPHDYLRDDNRWPWKSNSSLEQEHVECRLKPGCSYYALMSEEYILRREY
jgi:hypothetical protein